MAIPQRDNSIEEIKRLEPPSRVRYGAPGALLGMSFSQTRKRCGCWFVNSLEA